jgi:NRPS condensation-like uncharacterized protein
MSLKQQSANFDRKVSPSERFFSRSPYSIVTLVTRINGNVTESMLRNAVAKVRQRHVHLRYRIVEDENHDLWFTTSGTGDIPIEIVPREAAEDWKRIVQQSSQIPFEFEIEPALRIILVQATDISELVILCHHIICDGMSLAYLARDLMNHLGTPDLEVEILPDPIPIDLETLPDEVSQSGLAKYFITRINRKWNETRINFNDDDYKTITEAYWSNYKHEMMAIELSEAETSALVSRCKQEGVTVNSAIATAFLGAASMVEGSKPNHAKVVFASNLRDRVKQPVGEGVGMYAGGVELNYKFNQKVSFWENARSFHKKIKPRYVDKHLFKEALTWSSLEPSLIEAMTFKKMGQLVSSQKQGDNKLFDFSKRDDVVLSILQREKLDSFESIILGTAITNLTRMDFPKKFGELELDRMILKPGGAFPLSNVNLLVGAVTCSGKLSLILEYSDRNFDHAAVEEIKNKALSMMMS